MEDEKYYWTQEASEELLKFTEKWMKKWSPKLVAAKKDNTDYYLGDTSDDALAAAELLHAFLSHVNGFNGTPCMIRNANAREFMEPTALWDALELPPEDDE